MVSEAIKNTPAEALVEAVDRIGSQAAMAKLLGLSQPSIWKWLDRKKPLPAEHVLTVEQATGVSRHDLRPDIYPREEPSRPRATDPARRTGGTGAPASVPPGRGAERADRSAALGEPAR